MKKIRQFKSDERLKATLSIDCTKCCGLCCVALYCAKTEGFPKDKPGGKPCVNLCADFKCKVHGALKKKKLKGCLAYDCFGAGQKVTEKIYKNITWQDTPEKAAEMFDVFLKVRQLHQMCWYLLEGISLVSEGEKRQRIEAYVQENDRMTSGTPEAILALDLTDYQQRVNGVLKAICESLHRKYYGGQGQKKVVDWMGKSFHQADLTGMDFSMTFLIAADLEGCQLFGANFLGADMRDTVIKNTDLRESIFLTQGQINSAIGNAQTQLPEGLVYPSAWEK